MSKAFLAYPDIHDVLISRNLACGRQVTLRPDTADVEATHIYGVSGLDKRQLTQAVVEGRRQAHDLVHMMRHIPVPSLAASNATL